MAASGTFSRSLSLCLSISLATHSFPPTQSKCTSFFFFFRVLFRRRQPGLIGMLTYSPAAQTAAGRETEDLTGSWTAERKRWVEEGSGCGGGDMGGRGVEMLPVSCSATPLRRSSERTAALFIDGRYGSLCRSGRKSFGRQENFLDCFSHSRKFPLAG